MRPRRKPAGGSLDSLLDTMTNVVGILVIVLVVTQLGVRDAVDRISDSEAVDPALLADMRRQADEAERERKEKERLRDGAQGSDRQEVISKLGKIARELTDLHADLEGLQKSRQAKQAEIRAAADEAQGLLDAQRKVEQGLKRQIESALAAIAKLEAQLDETPQREIRPPEIVQVPNPRSAPEGAQPITFYCRKGRIAFLDAAEAQNRAVKQTQLNIAQRRLGDPAKGVECEKLFNDFNRKRFRDRKYNFEWRLEARGRYPYLVFVERDNFGETAEEITQGGADFREQVARFSPRTHYAQFLVWNDSFDEYIAARSIVGEAGFPAGWQPQTRQDEYRERLQSNLRCGPPPPPKPKPVPKPGEKPPPKPPPPRQFPDDVID
jgi:hypothetical protein